MPTNTNNEQPSQPPNDNTPSLPDHADVITHPPVIVLAAILVAVALHYLWPVTLPTHAHLAPSFGVALIVIALALFVWAVPQFFKVGTSIPPHRPSIALVHTGPYRLTRNPIYLSFMLLHLGLAIWINSLWVLLAIIPTALLLHHGVILREERYLERKLGQPYIDYKQSVRRWL